MRQATERMVCVCGNNCAAYVQKSKRNVGICHCVAGFISIYENSFLLCFFFVAAAAASFDHLCNVCVIYLVEWQRQNLFRLSSLSPCRRIISLLDIKCINLFTSTFWYDVQDLPTKTRHTKR